MSRDPIPPCMDPPRMGLFRAFRLVALIEGVTTILLFFVAMPMKYALDLPRAVEVMGPIHGYAFLAYILAMIAALWGRGWSAGDWLRTAAASLFPFGTFLNDPFLRRRIAQDSGGAGPVPGVSLAQAFYLGMGLVFTGLGFAGAFLPVLPTTPFLIVAAACFARSSRRLEGWLLRHPRFGPLLVAWRERGAIPIRAKWASLIGSAVGFALFWIGSDPAWWLAGLVAGLMIFGVGFVFSRPTA
ncbi:DUF454 family protein [uncultured Paracoccus sp.]|uniref:DUF454 family protein n=1 Tax=uncultured Paracoccus sp. TaxID=189685 RepID=UPI0025D85302|nr:DUF454 family protein [uncultured Paracoccus sp.]